MTTDIQNLKSFDPFAEAEDSVGDVKTTSQNYIHIRIQQRNGRKTLTTVQGLPKKFDQKKILKVIKKKFACNGTVVTDSEMGEVIQLQGDQRKDVQEFLTDKKEGLGLGRQNHQSPRFLSRLCRRAPRPATVTVSRNSRLQPSMLDKYSRRSVTRLEAQSAGGADHAAQLR
ncbi:Eukaryotic translation initiation factor eIF-1 [Kalmusia sp. IMI 367209]|nr:Eukaryotic translation initiation factor eIF-1 [Kalmusia sp. IMI 367209]